MINITDVTLYYILW